jgi:hypothetical protein
MLINFRLLIPFPGRPGKNSALAMPWQVFVGGLGWSYDSQAMMGHVL